MTMKSVLVTGGTGTFGRAFVNDCLQRNVNRIVVYSRDEQKQEEMARQLGNSLNRDTLRFFIGDVRDASRLKMALRGIDTVIHAAALKIVPACEYNPVEAVRTNIGGAENVITAALETGVKKVIALSTDKAVSPVNLYGATKLAAERLFIAANNLSGASGDGLGACQFSVVRYGNVAGSRGSIIPLFKKLVEEGAPVPITHMDMTRFWITVEDAVRFVTECHGRMRGGEIFVPKMPSFRVVDLANAISDNFTFPKWNTLAAVALRVVGMRPGEKLHETLVTPHDTPLLSTLPDYFIIHPNWKPPAYDLSDFRYSSDNNQFLSIQQLRRLAQ